MAEINITSSFKFGDITHIYTEITSGYYVMLSKKYDKKELKNIRFFNKSNIHDKQGQRSIALSLVSVI